MTDNTKLDDIHDRLSKVERQIHLLSNPAEKAEAQARQKIGFWGYMEQPPNRLSYWILFWGLCIVAGALIGK